MKVRALVIPAVLLAVLAGCTPQAPAPGISPDPTPDANESAPAPSETPSPEPTQAAVALPGSCDSLVSLDVVQSEFSPQFESIAIGPGYGDPVAQDFLARGGLTCLWGIPQSGAGVTMFVAERATSTDAGQIAQWSAAGYTPCSSFDACFSNVTSSEEGDFYSLYALIGGFELQALSSVGALDAQIAVANAAAANMGYR